MDQHASSPGQNVSLSVETLQSGHGALFTEHDGLHARYALQTHIHDVGVGGPDVHRQRLQRVVGGAADAEFCWREAEPGVGKGGGEIGGGWGAEGVD